MGDGVLVEFQRAVNAVKAALELQERFAKANERLLGHQHVVLRIGINLGDVVGEGTDVYGDGVNIAARLEGLSEPGGICIAGNIRDTIHGKLKLDVEDLGEVVLKNIARPIRAYRVKNNSSAFIQGSISTPREDVLSLAILPFDNMSGIPEQDYIGDGIA